MLPNEKDGVLVDAPALVCGVADGVPNEKVGFACCWPAGEANEPEESDTQKVSKGDSLV